MYSKIKLYFLITKKTAGFGGKKQIWRNKEDKYIYQGTLSKMQIWDAEKLMFGDGSHLKVPINWSL